jgi:hypothetical protein
MAWRELEAPYEAAKARVLVGLACRQPSPLQRRLRDIRALTQHFVVKLDTFTKAGAVLLGQDVDLTFL